MASPDNLIRVPKPARKSYNPDRPLETNTLLKAQVRHFHHVEQSLPPEYRTGIDVQTLRTEGEASEYIRTVTAAIHSQAAHAAKTKQAP